MLLRLFIALACFSLCLSDHYKGGTIRWRPVNSTLLTNPVPVIISVHQSWFSSRYPCNRSTYNVPGAYNDVLNGALPTIVCISSAASCAASGFTSITLQFTCTDYSSIFRVSTGFYSTQQNLNLNSDIEIAWRGASWSLETNTNSWSMISRINLVPTSNIINSAPGNLIASFG
jgi:hypothetical protein